MSLLDPFRRGALRALCACAAVLLGACGSDSPVEVGAGLLPAEPVTTFEVVLEADQFLALDSAFALYNQPADAGFAMIAADYAGVLDAHALNRFSIVRTITVRDTLANSVRIDSLPRYFGGRLVVRIDTVRTPLGSVQLSAYQSMESWDAGSATWQTRIDSGTVELPWTQPGGTLGPQITTGEWLRTEGDSLVMAIDSATLAVLRDSTVARQGIIIVSETPGSRVRVSEIVLRADARSSLPTDTVVTTTGVNLGRTFIYDPAPEPRIDATRVGGVPSYRTLIRLRDDLGDLVIECPDDFGEAGCAVPLRDAAITSALLEYTLAAPPPEFVPEDSVLFAALPLLETPGVPFARSPLGSVSQAIGGSRFIRPADFDDVTTADPVRFVVTTAIRQAASEDAAAIGIAIIPALELSTFGFVPLQPAPRLRLVLTTSREVQLQ